MPSPTSALGAALAGLEIDPQRPIESLQNGLAKNAAVLIELFKSWDADNDGTRKVGETRVGLYAARTGEYDDCFGNGEHEKRFFLAGDGVPKEDQRRVVVERCSTLTPT